MTARVLFYVQHLMGVGHVFRAMRLVRALDAAGMAVDLVWGGEPIPNLDAGGATVHFLPSLKAGAKVFKDMEDRDGNVVDQAYRDKRRDMLLDIFHSTRPDIVITEAFPFGRRQMFFELLPLLEAVKAADMRPKLLCSVRDILQENRKPVRDRETTDLLLSHYDGILVHADPSFVRLEDTFPHHDEIEHLVMYTGIVAPEAEDTVDPGSIEAFDVVVSVGGGVMGRELLFAAAEAKQLTKLAGGKWCFITGINTSPEDVAHVRSLVSGDVTIVEFVPHLRSLLSKCGISVSRAGYNTVADVFRAGCKAVFAPLSDGEETEQIRRVELLAAKGLAATVAADDLDAASLARAIDDAHAAPLARQNLPKLEGARTTADIVAKLAKGTPVDAVAV